MLAQLIVRDLGIIHNLNWTLTPGLNVITGETGAGKSLVIDAIELLLEVPPSGSEMIRFGCERALVEGVFELAEMPLAGLRQFLGESGLEAEDDRLVISYELKSQKSAPPRINGRAVTRAILRRAGDYLIDIQGQSGHHSLLDRKNHILLLDSFGHLTSAREQFSAALASLEDLESEIGRLVQKRQGIEQRMELLSYQIDEIRAAKLTPGEEERLERERRLAAHSEKLRELSQRAYGALTEEGSSYESSSALTRINEALGSLKRLVEFDPSLHPHLESLERSFYSLDDVARELRSYSDSLTETTTRLDEIESRVEFISNLKRKYGNDIPAILEFQTSAEAELSDLDSSQDNLARLESQRSILRKNLGLQAATLSSARRQAAQDLEKAVRGELVELEMDQVQFSVALELEDSQAGLDDGTGRLLRYNSLGFEQVEFLVSTNPGEPLKPLVNIASTGETSRFTLALKAALSEADDIPILVFDEIDIGVGGRSGDVLAKKLWRLSRRHQVICVTHLAQIAAYADRHFTARKMANAERTISVIEEIAQDSRLREMAMMLAGKDYSPTALRNARELQDKALLWKRSFAARE